MARRDCPICEKSFWDVQYPDHLCWVPETPINTPVYERLPNGKTESKMS